MSADAFLIIVGRAAHTLGIDPDDVRACVIGDGEVCVLFQSDAFDATTRSIVSILKEATVRMSPSGQWSVGDPPTVSNVTLEGLG